MGTVSLAFLWHFHQPCYRDLLSGSVFMPWVRLHGIKDYTGMAALLEEFPAMRCTANFSPVLLDQLDAYVKGGGDAMLELSLVPAGSLTEEQKSAILSRFFWAHPESVIGAYPRFRQLLELHRGGNPLRDQDFRDLQVLANLAWFHPTVTSIEDLRRKGSGYSEEDKQVLAGRMRETLAGLLPRWKALGDRVEFSVSPYYHPIIPLLCDFASAREAMPDLPLPKARSFKSEAEVQIRKALEAGERYFGRRPQGMWPSEGSVSTEACDLFAQCGVRWVATDEDIVGASGVRRYGDLKIAFRDKTLSNLIGFSYKAMPPEEAARDFIRRLEGREGVVPVILDGENPWEYYPGGAVDFLRALYRRLSDHPTIRTVTMSEAAASGRMDRVFAGSWINRSFGVWIGHEEDRRGWELLDRTRADLESSSDPLVWECIRAAEGSDWFWWFGEDFTSAQDTEFDALFRRHLMNAYRAAGKPWPEELQRPIKPARREAAFKSPWAMLDVRIDGRRSDYYEWIAAGHYDMSKEYGAIAGESSFIRDVYYGFDEKNLFVRLDFRAGVDPKTALAGGELRVIVTRPRHAAVALEGKADEIYEAAAPFASLDVRPGEEVEFFLEFEQSGAAPVRVPTIAPLWFRAPAGDSEKVQWVSEREGVPSSWRNIMPELRRDPVVGRWVIISVDRAKRPDDFKIFAAAPAAKPVICPFCPGNEGMTPPEISAVRNNEGWRVRVVPNKFPALRVEGDLGKRGDGMYDMMSGVGAHEVVIETPRHEVSLTGLSEGEVRDVLWMYKQRLLDLSKDPRLVYGLVFKNVGERAGASLEHSHSQIILTPIVPLRVQTEIDRCVEYYQYRGRCLLCDMVVQEMSSGARLVMDTPNFLAFEPFAARFPFETHILPKRHMSHFEFTEDGLLPELARCLRTTLAKIERAVSNPPYNYLIHTTPLNSKPLDHYHWHFEIIPRITRTAGFEWGTGFYINPVPPEHAAQYLREVKV